MQNFNFPSGTGDKFLNLVDSSEVTLGYQSTLNYLDGQVDFDGSQINNNTYALGYSYTPFSNTAIPMNLTHFNGQDNSCQVGLFASDNASLSSSNDVKFPLIRNLCHIKTKYLSISGTNIVIAVTNSQVLFQDTTSAWEVDGTVKYMVKDSIPNVKYFLTAGQGEKPTGGLANPTPAFHATCVEGGAIFPMYFPKRDTLMLQDQRLFPNH